MARASVKAALLVSAALALAAPAAQGAMAVFDGSMVGKAAVKSRRDPARIVRPGEMLVLVAGHPPILGRQPLYFLDRTLLERSQIAPIGADRDDGESESESSPEPSASPTSAESSGIADRIRAAARSSSQSTTP